MGTNRLVQCHFAALNHVGEENSGERFGHGSDEKLAVLVQAQLIVSKWLTIAVVASRTPV